ncbi:MAG: DUF465 domain-containing protein [Gammaproteobacteria bacterium]|nr:MAG: DUF465 domain-containing protein [Gammaproteobacteria bacterium]
MIRWNHDIYHELPELRDRIEAIGNRDPSIRRLIERYHQVTETVQDIQRHRRAVDAEQIKALKRQRLHLKDTLYSLLRTH